MQRAEEEETKQVRLLYSTKPVRVSLGKREYIIPANYFGPKEKDGRDTYDAGAAGYFGFVLFLPEYGGYTTDNWRDKFDRRLIEVLDVKTVDKNEMVFHPDRGYERVNPAGYGDPTARFQNARPGLEDRPSIQAYGLQGFRPKGSNAGVTWTGKRGNGEFVFFRCHLAPGDQQQAGTHPLCDVRYFSEQEDLFIAYRYSNDHLPKWREIDDAVWAKLRQWEVR